MIADSLVYLYEGLRASEFGCGNLWADTPTYRCTGQERVARGLRGHRRNRCWIRTASVRVIDMEDLEGNWRSSVGVRRLFIEGGKEGNTAQPESGVLFVV